MVPALKDWALNSPWPGRLLAVMRLLMDHAGTAIVFVVAIPVYPAKDLLFLLVVGMAWGGLTRGAILRWRDTVNLRHLGRLLAENPVAGIHRAADYFPTGLQTLPGRQAPVDRGDWTILHVPGAAPVAYQYADWRSWIVFGFPPGRLNPARTFALLHEMGHIGPRNYLTATTETRYPQLGAKRRLGLDASNKLVLRRLRLVLTRRRMAKAFFMAVSRRPTLHWFGLAALAPLIIFFPVDSMLPPMVAGVAAYFAGSLNKFGLRREAEVEADHFAVEQMMLVEIASRGAGIYERRHPLSGGGFTPPRDPDLSEDDHLLRIGAFDWMRSDAVDSIIKAEVESKLRVADGRAPAVLLRPAWFFRWRFGALSEAIWMLVRLPVLAVATVALTLTAAPSVNPPWQALALVFPALLLGLAVLLKRRQTRDLGLILRAAA